MLTIVGDDELDLIELPNGMNIRMEFSIDKSGLKRMFSTEICKTIMFKIFI